MRTARSLLVGLLVALLATGCVTVPTSGPVEKVVGEPPACQDCVNVEVAPPAPGDSPLQIVEGYLRATSNFQPDYAVARQFLSTAAATTWTPDEAVTVYDGKPSGDDAGIRLQGRMVASLRKDRTYLARDETLSVAFPVVQENGQWRISKPPPGLFVAEFAFRDFYQPVNRYFLSNGIGASLVPDPIYVLSARNPANLASGLVTSLLDGPSDWLEPAVTSAIPPDTTLSVDSVPITNGIAEVALSDNVLTLTDPERALLAAQIVYTLKQLSIIKGVVITVNQQKFRVPQSDPTTLVVGVDDIEPGLQPVPPAASSQLYLLRRGKIEVLEKITDATTTTLHTDVGRGQYEMNSLAVSVTNTDLALVTDGRTQLRLTQTTPGAPVTTPLGGVTNLLRPQFSRYGEVWAIGQENGRQKIFKFGGGPLLEAPDKKFFAAGEITAFKISPDGTRMALIRRTRSGSELGVARISRTDKVRVDGWRVLDTTQSELPKITRMLDIGWIDPTTMLVLGAATADSGVEPFEVSQDAAQISNEGVSNNWEAVEVAVQLPGPVPVVRGQDKEKQTYVDNGSEWLRLVNGVDAIAYPG